MRSPLALALLLAAASASSALADPTPAASKEADRLFEEGRQLLAAGRAAEACPDFEKSQTLDPGRGTLINLAACYEAIGHLVKALATYRDVHAQSVAAKDRPREQESQKRIDSLVARIPHLAIDVGAGARPTGFTVDVAGEAVAPASYRDVLVDPGDVAVSASAPGFERWETRVTTTDGERARVTIPPLAPAPVKEVVVPKTTVVRSERHKDGKRVIEAVALGGTGAVAFGGSIVLAIVAKKSYDAALTDHCHSSASDCDATGLDATRNARSRGNLATIVGAAGLAAVAGAALLYLTAPTVETERAALVPQLSAGSAGLAIVGSF